MVIDLCSDDEVTIEESGKDEPRAPTHPRQPPASRGVWEDDEEESDDEFSMIRGMGGFGGNSSSSSKRGDGGIRSWSKGEGGSNTCFKCGQAGHYANSCTNGGVRGGGRSNSCFKCGQAGHYSNNCPSARGGAGGGSSGNSSGKTWGRGASSSTGKSGWPGQGRSSIEATAVRAGGGNSSATQTAAKARRDGQTDSAAGRGPSTSSSSADAPAKGMAASGKPASSTAKCAMCGEQCAAGSSENICGVCSSFALSDDSAWVEADDDMAPVQQQQQQQQQQQRMAPRFGERVGRDSHTSQQRTEKETPQKSWGESEAKSHGPKTPNPPTGSSPNKLQVKDFAEWKRGLIEGGGSHASAPKTPGLGMLEKLTGRGGGNNEPEDIKDNGALDLVKKMTSLAGGGVKRKPLHQVVETTSQVAKKSRSLNLFSKDESKAGVRAASQVKSSVATHSTAWTKEEDLDKLLRISHNNNLSWEGYGAATI